MIDSIALNDALSLLLSSWSPWIVVFPGIVIGLVAGAVPGVQLSMAMAIFLPATFAMDFLQSMLFLTAIFTGGGFASAVPAILMNIPGTSASVATTFDGYPMARQGMHNQALGIALAASTAGSLFGYMYLFVLIDPIAKIVLRLGPTEYLMIVLWGLTLIAMLHSGSALRGLLAGIIGLLCGTVGMSDLGVIRGTMGIPNLLDGVALVPAMIGMFAASSLFNLASKKYLVESEAQRKLDFRAIVVGFLQAFRYPRALVTGSLCGAFIGSIPGVGASISNLVSYALTRRRDADPSSFGKGNPKGVVAAEAANSSGEGGSLVTLLALGIPGGGATAIMMAAFAMRNITGGPTFIREQTDVVYAIILANMVQIIILIALGLAFIHVLASVVKVPLRILAPSVLVLAFYGSYAFTGSMDGPATVIVFGVLGWLMARYSYSIPAFVVGLILGPMAEGELLRSYQISGGSFDYIIGRPVTLLLAALLVLTILAPVLRNYLRRRRKASNAAAQ